MARVSSVVEIDNELKNQEFSYGEYQEAWPLALCDSLFYANLKM